jgi:hydrogenase nickel incorporation protein HypA/HybF
MHEVSIVEGLIEILLDVARENGLSKVTRITLRIGEMRQIVPDALYFAFEAVGKGTIAEGAEIVINSVPTCARCSDCSNEFSVEEYCFFCPSCSSRNVSVIKGKELFVDSIEGE